MKKIVVISMVKNEQDIIESFVRHCLTFADELLICDHMSSDQTRCILNHLLDEGQPIQVYEEKNPAHVQSEVMTRLMYRALGKAGADLVLPLDADEFLIPADGAGQVRDSLQELDTAQVYHVPWRIYAPARPHEQEDQFMLDRPLLMASADADGQKILFGRKAVGDAAVVLTEGNHNLLQTGTNGETVFFPRQRQEKVRIAHFCWRSPEQFVAKIAIGRMNTIAKYSSYSGSAGNYDRLSQQFLDEGMPRMQDILPAGMVPVDLSAGLRGQVLRYSHAVRPDPLRNLMAASTLLAQRYVEDRVLQKQKWVTILIPYLGDWNTVCTSVRSAVAQTYPWKEIFLLADMSLPAAYQEQLQREFGDAVTVVAGKTEAARAGQLSERTQGSYVQWLLPGDQIQEERLQKMLTCAETQDVRFAVLISIEKAKDEDMGRFMVIQQQESLAMGYRNVWWTHLQNERKMPAGGIGAALIRREVMENRQWLQACFMDSRTLGFTMWRALLQECPEDGVWQLLGIMNAAYLQQLHDTTAWDNWGNDGRQGDVAGRISAAVPDAQVEGEKPMGITSIVIVSYNTYEYTKQCIESIREYTKPGSYEILVVDNASTDATPDWLREQTDVRSLFNVENAGFPKGCNQGMAIARGTEILLLNSDTIVTAHWLDNLLRALYSQDNIGAVSCMTNCCANAQQVNAKYSDREGMQNFAAQYNHSNPACWRRWMTLVGFCFLFRRELYERLGGLDEAFSPGNYEDDDYSLRIRRAGYELLLCQDTFIHHFGSVSFRQARSEAERQSKDQQYAYLSARNKKMLCDKWELSSDYKTLHTIIKALPDKLPAGARVFLVHGSLLDFFILRESYSGIELSGILRMPGEAALTASFVRAEVQEDITLAGVNLGDGMYDYILFPNREEMIAGLEQIIMRCRQQLKPSGKVVYWQDDQLQEAEAVENVLVLSHNLGGGAIVFLQQYIEQYGQDKRWFCLTPDPAGTMAVQKYVIWAVNAPDEKYPVAFAAAELSRAVQDLHIRSIFVNSLTGHPLPLISDWLLAIKIPYTFFLHDYVCICPDLMLDCRQRYCAQNETHAFCRSRFREKNMASVSLQTYQQIFRQLLQQAEKVQAPTHYAAQIVQQTYPEVSIEVCPHHLNLPLQRTFREEFAKDEPLNIVFLGFMWKPKGAAYLLQLNEYIQARQLPIQLTVLGKYVREGLPGSEDGIRFLGAYDNQQISDLLRQQRTALVAALSDWPETYCYTASEAILSGYPVVAFNVGAHALRIQKNDCGWLIPINSLSRGLEELELFARYITTPAGRQDICRKARNTERFENGME